MGGDEGSKAGLAHQRFQRVEDVACRFGVKIAGWLVGKKQSRRIGDGAGNCDALLLAAGKLAGAMRATMADAHIIEKLAGPLSGFLPGKPGDQLRHHDIFERREFRQQMVELVDKADFAAADGGAFLIAQAVTGMAVDVDLTAVRMLQQAGDMQQCRLAGAGRGDESDNLPFDIEKSAPFRIESSVPPCP